MNHKEIDRERCGRRNSGWSNRRRKCSIRPTPPSARKDVAIADRFSKSLQSPFLFALTNPDPCNDRDTMARGIGLKRRSIFSDDEGRQQRRKFVACVAPLSPHIHTGLTSELQLPTMPCA